MVINEMPTMLTTICIQMAPETSTNTKWAAKDRNMPAQNTSSDC